MYKALKRGYDGVKVIEAGEVFMFAGEPGSWMELADKSAKPGNEHVLLSGQAKDHELALQEEHSHDNEAVINTKNVVLKPSGKK